jgi:CHAT domain
MAQESEDHSASDHQHSQIVYQISANLLLLFLLFSLPLGAPSHRAFGRQLRVSYYRMLQQGQGRGEALRQVQLEMLKQVNRKHPYYWASFIQSGEWANLEGKRTR